MSAVHDLASGANHIDIFVSCQDAFYKQEWLICAPSRWRLRP